MKIIGPIPNKCFLAFSGGADSCAALSFLLNGRKDVELIHYNHGTEYSSQAEEFVKKISENLDLKSHYCRISNFREKESGESKEEYWRNARYDFFNKFTSRKIITAHHLDDCIETWIFGSLHGSPKLIPYSRNDIGGGVVRPFLASSRKELVEFFNRRNMSGLKEWVEDPSNKDTRYMRNLIRQEMIPAAFKVNPGLHKVIRNKVLDSLN